jgi:hypothetical protein
MLRLLRSCVLTILLLATSAALANFHTFRIEQIYSNADGTVQFVVMHEAFSTNGENLWMNQVLTGNDGMSTKSFTFPSNLPSSNTAGRRVLIATPGFAALGLVTPDFLIPSGFLPRGNGTINTVNFAGVDHVDYASLPADSSKAIDHSAAPVPNVATNFAGLSGSIAGPAIAFVPSVGLWWNPAEDGTGYNFDVKHGVLVMSMFSYEAGGHSEWYVAAGPLTDNGTKFTGTLDKYRGGQCLTCPFTGKPTLVGNDGTVSITFSSSTSAVITLPNNRVSPIQPQVF